MQTQKLKRQKDLDNMKKQVEATRKSRSKATAVTKSAPKGLPNQTRQERDLAKAEKLRAKLAELEARVSKGAAVDPGGSRNTEKKESGLSNLIGYSESGEELTDSSDSSSLESSSVSSSDDSVNSDNKAEEAAATVNKIQDEEPLVKADTPVSQPKSRKLCNYFMMKGHCRQGENCRFRHSQESLQQQQQRQKKGKRVSLYQRFVDQELAKENRRALEAIKYLGQHGALSEVKTATPGT